MFLSEQYRVAKGVLELLLCILALVFGLLNLRKYGQREFMAIYGSNISSLC